MYQIAICISNNIVVIYDRCVNEELKRIVIGILDQLVDHFYCKEHVLVAFRIRKKLGIIGALHEKVRLGYLKNC